MKKLAYLLKSLVFIVVLILLAGMAFIHRDFLWEQTKVARAFYYVWQGDESIKKNNFQAAIDNYKTALKIYPEHAKAHYNLGNIYFWYEVYTASPVKKPIKTYRYDKDLDKFVLHVEEPTGETDKENNAEAAYMKATEVQPNFINAWINLGLVRLNQYNLEGAIKSFMKAINADPTIVKIPFIFNNEQSIKYNRAVAYYNLALVYDQMASSTDYNDLRVSYLLEALRYYQKALNINNDSFKTNFNLAYTNQQLGRNTSAIDYYCKSIKLDPFKYPAHYNLGILLRNQERYIGSADELKKAAMLIDSGKDMAKAEYVFRILNDVSLRAAAYELSKIKHFQETYYDIPSTGIIAEVIGKPLLEKQKKLQIEQDQKEAKENEEVSSQIDQVTKYFSSCVTDPDYYEKEKEKYELKPDWIDVSNTYIDKITEISENKPVPE
ncbi:MAG: tetratricopeptide repeat protein [Cyanobacteriota bacterium]